MRTVETQSQTFHWRFQNPPEKIWPLLADTVRFNEAAGLPRYEVTETLQDDGTVRFEGAAKIGPVNLAWREVPTNWVTGRWFEHRREFKTGPLKDMTASLVVTAEEGGKACHADYTLSATPASLLGRLILKAGFFSNTAKTFARLAVDADRFAAGASPFPFTFKAPPPTPATRELVTELIARIEAGPHGHGLAQRLADHLLSAQESDLVHLRPLALARDWAEDERLVIELCLESVRAGLLTMRWDLLCPRCRVPKAAVEALDGLPQGAHCDTCNIDYGRDFSRNVELSFAPAPAVRPLGAGEHCLFGPMSTPHVWVQRTVEAGAGLSEVCDLPPGRYVLRTLEAGPDCEVEVAEGGGLPEVLIAEDSVTPGPAADPGQVVLRNDTSRPRTVIVEELRWVRDALTADRVTAMQAFRDLFSDQVLRPGDEVSVSRIALLFTDLRRSTDLYGRIGDAAAYHLVRDHFAFIGAIVRRHNGAVVKTIGDAVMAAFAAPADAVEAGLAVQREIAAFNAGEQVPVAIKLGVHEGPCIAVTLNGRLDYFGTTVNMAARLQGKSEGGDLVLSEAVAGDLPVVRLLDGISCLRETTSLKGFDAPVDFCRVRL